MIRLYIFIFFITSFSYAQNYTITGVVFDDKEKPLESANIIAKPLTEKATLKFAIADNKGRYRLELEANIKH
ncbi:MAG: hypothetical protein ACOVQC_05735 [Flavobacterium sp.]